MRHWHHCGLTVSLQVFSPVPHGLGQAFLLVPSKMVGLRVLADDKDQLNFRHGGKDPVVPVRPAFTARWQVAALAVQPGKTQAHGDDRNFRGIIKRISVDPHPLSEAISRGIGERPSAFVNLCSWRLTTDANSSLIRELNDRPGLVGKRRGQWLLNTNAATRNLRLQISQPILCPCCARHRFLPTLGLCLRFVYHIPEGDLKKS